MSRRWASVACCVVLVVLGFQRDTVEGQGKLPVRVNLSELSLEVTALQTLYELDLTNAQLKTLAELAKITSPRLRPRTPPRAGSVRLSRIMSDLRDALVKNDVARIDDLNAKLDTLKESEDVKLDDDVKITDLARKRAPLALQLLTADQMADYLNTYDEMPDPFSSIHDALRSGLTADAKRWVTLRDEAATEVGWLVAGFDKDMAQKVKEQTLELLEKAHPWTEDELAKRQEDLEKAVREILGDVGPIEVLQNIMERDLAELLSNPMLPRVLEARLKEAK
ncbi:MAG: hypothetical protein K2R98_08640 [Gemmataceae bacterium]|nr:hypothetical protein [Gemmataceae bacterium]